MKRKLKAAISVIMISVFTAMMFVGCGKSEDNTMTKVRLNEVTRSVFYAPMYIAMSEGYFKENGLDIDLQTGQAPKTQMQRFTQNFHKKIYFFLLEELPTKFILKSWVSPFQVIVSTRPLIRSLVSSCDNVSTIEHRSRRYLIKESSNSSFLILFNFSSEFCISLFS